MSLAVEDNGSDSRKFTLLKVVELEASWNLLSSNVEMISTADL